MTNSSIDSHYLAPNHFHTGSTISNGYSLKCPLCNVSRKLFYCRDCVRSGNFSHSSNTNHLSERFAEKQLKYFETKSIYYSLENRAKKLLENRIKEENLKMAIKRRKEKLYNLHELIKETEENLKIKKTYKDEIIKLNKNTNKRFRQFESRVTELGEYTKDRIEVNENLKKKYYDLEHHLKYYIRNNIENLINFIFPISQQSSMTQSQSDSNSSTSCDMKPDALNELAEATHTAFVRGKWVVQSDDPGYFNLNYIQYSILSATLPGNGDYSAYNDWICAKKNKHNLQHNVNVTTPVGSGNVSQNTDGTGSDLVNISNDAAFKIIAALTYITQLTLILSFYLDVRLPYKIIFSDYCRRELDERSFKRKVARLNANILHLCYTQGVKLTELVPSHTLENIMNLLDTNKSNLGRSGPVHVINYITPKIDKQLLEGLLTGDDSETDDDNSIPNEWETIPLSTVETPPPSSSHNTQQSGLVTSTVASVASFFRGWTTGR